MVGKVALCRSTNHFGSSKRRRPQSDSEAPCISATSFPFCIPEVSANPAVFSSFLEKLQIFPKFWRTPSRPNASLVCDVKRSPAAELILWDRIEESNVERRTY